MSCCLSFAESHILPFPLPNVNWLKVDVIVGYYSKCYLFYVNEILFNTVSVCCVCNGHISHINLGGGIGAISSTSKNTLMIISSWQWILLTAQGIDHIKYVFLKIHSRNKRGFHCIFFTLPHLSKEKKNKPLISAASGRERVAHLPHNPFSWSLWHVQSWHISCSKSLFLHRQTGTQSYWA